MVTEEQITEAEGKQAVLLTRIQDIDKELSALTPADPKRRELTAEKQEILPRYRGAKTHAKNLRRTWNSHPGSPRQDSPAEAMRQLIHQHDAQGEETVKVDPEELMGRLYEVLADIASDAHNGGQPIVIEEDDVEVIDDFLNWWEHTHDIEVDRS